MKNYFWKYQTFKNAVYLFSSRFSQFCLPIDQFKLILDLGGNPIYFQISKIHSTYLIQRHINIMV